MLRCSTACWCQAKNVMGVCVLMNLGASSGQIITILVNTVVGAEVSIHTLELLVWEWMPY